MPPWDPVTERQGFNAYLIKKLGAPARQALQHALINCRRDNMCLFAWFEFLMANTRRHAACSLRLWRQRCSVRAIYGRRRTTADYFHISTHSVLLDLLTTHLLLLVICKTFQSLFSTSVIIDTTVSGDGVFDLLYFFSFSVFIITPPLYRSWGLKAC